jgi:predicted transcriptional regulator
MEAKSMRVAIIRIRDANQAMQDLQSGFVSAWNKETYQAELFDFESPAALFKVLSPKRWELIQTLQKSRPMSIRALARFLNRDIKRVYEDVQLMLEYGLIETNLEDEILVPFAEIRADFVMKSAA